MMDFKTICLVIFTCESREHLLLKSFESFSGSCRDVFAYKLLVVDGKISQATIDAVSPNIVIQSTERKGYVNSIINALNNIHTDYFFWLEDDWEFPYLFSMSDLISFLQEQNVLQITLAKEPFNNKFELYKAPDVYVNGSGFSANPCLCRTADIKEIFKEIVAYKKDENSKFLSFEGVATTYTQRKNLVLLIKYYDKLAFVNHKGDLESTAREYHMINSLSIPLNSENGGYISGLNHFQKPGFYNKLSLCIKLWIATFHLSIKLLFSREAYDFAFRIYLASLKRFKS
ncbi:MAG: hypothetical protein JWR02_2317 [Mucilaginibacter sp.]|nr:hypothetical protein [Mucilaginibacter sp.]